MPRVEGARGTRGRTGWKACATGFRADRRGRLSYKKKSGYGHLFAEESVLNGVEEFHPFFHRPMEGLRPEMRPMPPARLLITAVRTASARSFLPEPPPELISPARPM